MGAGSIVTRKKSSAQLDTEIAAVLAKKKRPMRCPDCGSGLKLDDPSYGLTCPRCEARVSEPFESARDIPDYVAVPSSGTLVATIRFKGATSRRAYLKALRARLYEADYSSDQVDDMFERAFHPQENVGHVYSSRADAERAVDVAAGVVGVTAELGRAA